MIVAVVSGLTVGFFGHCGQRLARCCLHLIRPHVECQSARDRNSNGLPRRCLRCEQGTAVQGFVDCVPPILPRETAHECVLVWYCCTPFRATEFPGLDDDCKLMVTIVEAAFTVKRLYVLFCFSFFCCRRATPVAVKRMSRFVSPFFVVAVQPLWQIQSKAGGKPRARAWNGFTLSWT